MLPPRYEGPVINDFLMTLTQAQAELGDIFRMPLGKQDLIIVCDNELAYDILAKQNRTFVKLGADGGKPGLQRILGTGLLTNPDYESWFARRQLLQPFFRKNQLERFADRMVAAAQRLLERWRASAIESVNLTEAMFELSLEIMFELVFSLGSAEAKKYPLLVPLSLASAKRAHVKRVSEELDKLVYPLIESRRLALSQGEIFDDFLDLLLCAKDAKTQKGLSDEEIRDELLTIFAAGHETTANALIWAIQLLATQTEPLKRLEHELGAYQDSLSSKSLKDLSYLQAVFKETLRLYPTIPFAPRVTLSETKLGRFSIPKGSKVFVSIYTIHSNPKIWEKAHMFYPERFLQQSSSFAYLPFGLGERVCVGQHLAALEFQLILAVLFKGLRFELLADVSTPKVAISLQGKDDVFVKLHFK